MIAWELYSISQGAKQKLCLLSLSPVNGALPKYNHTTFLGLYVLGRRVLSQICFLIVLSALSTDRFGKEKKETRTPRAPAGETPASPFHSPFHVFALACRDKENIVSSMTSNAWETRSTITKRVFRSQRRPALRSVFVVVG